MINKPKCDLQLLMLYKSKLEHNASKYSININRAWVKGSTCDQTVWRYFQKFCRRDESLEDDEGRGQACSLENKLLQAVVEKNPCHCVRNIFHVIYRALER